MIRYIQFDLHGNSKKNEVSPDGNIDENVFDIMQGVSINFFVKTGKKRTIKLGDIFHFDLFGKRQIKYDFLMNNKIESIKFNKLKPEKPFLFFIPKNNIGIAEYEQGFSVDELFPVNVTGIVTARDHFVIDFEKSVLKKRIEDFVDNSQSDDLIRNKYFGNKKEGKYLSGDSRGWKMIEARKKIRNFNHDKIIQKIAYRIFDDRFIYYDSSMVDWGREKFMFHLNNNLNIGLDLCRQLVSDEYSHIFITNKIVDDSFVSNKSRERGYVFPLYLYPLNKEQQTIEIGPKRTPNLNSEILKKIIVNLGIDFTNEVEENTFAPINLFDYIYSVLHSPTYRTLYKEFLKVDFPKVPYPKNKEKFWQLVRLGGLLREIHLMENPVLDKLITKFPYDGSNIVKTVKFEKNENEVGNVKINETQVFANVPQSAWDFYIGGYQPAQKWLKDRKGRELSFDEILHYQKIIVALKETDRIMKEIDKIEIL